MHEADAMEFIETVYCDFAHRKYTFKNVSEQDMGMCLDLIRVFITDDSGYWVKDKAVYIVDTLLNYDDCFDSYPSGILDCIKNVLRKVASEITEGMEKKGNRVFTSFPAPALVVSELITHHQKSF